jgi:polygalacturonase
MRPVFPLIFASRRCRNAFRFGALLTGLVLGISLITASPALTQTSPGDWARVPDILARIVPPVFPARDFVITNYGAVGDGATDCTSAFAGAIVACNAAGGGRVVVPGGTFLTGAIHLLSNVNLYVAAGGKILFSPDPSAFLPVVFTRYEGTEAMNYSPFIYAFEQQNIAVTGEGLIDGQGQLGPWYDWKNSGLADQEGNTLVAMAAANLPVAQRVFGAGHYLRPVFAQPFRCRNVLIEGVTLTNAPMWVLNPVYCTNVTIRGVTVNSSGPNSDGCDPDSATDVLIRDCSFSEGDDCIAVKSGRDADGRRVNVPCRNVVIQNCKFQDGHGGVTLGSETAGGVTNIFAENCSLNSANLEKALRFKTCPQRGGYIQNVYIRNCIIKTAQVGVHMDLQYCTGGTNYPVVCNIDIRDCAFSNAVQAVYLRGYNTANPITDVTVANCRFLKTSSANSYSNTNRISFLNNKGGGF